MQTILLLLAWLFDKLAHFTLWLSVGLIELGKKRKGV